MQSEMVIDIRAVRLRSSKQSGNVAMEISTVVVNDLTFWSPSHCDRHIEIMNDLGDGTVKKQV